MGIQVHDVPWSEVKMLVLDFDGTVTDSVKYFNESGTAFKRSDGRDGVGMYMIARTLNIPVHVITNENSSHTRAWCEKHMATFHHCDYGNTKDTILRKICTGHGVDLQDVCFVGDDITDLCALNIVGVPVVVSDAHPMTLAVQTFFVTSLRGGDGAVREVCDYIYYSRDDVECLMACRRRTSYACKNCSQHELMKKSGQERVIILESMYSKGA